MKEKMCNIPPNLSEEQYVIIPVFGGHHCICSKYVTNAVM